MIHIVDKKKCCGCSACEQACPRQCILMQEDCEGFIYPRVDLVSCVECGVCERVCPVINQSPSRSPLVVYAAKNSNDEIRLKSSSGGIFTTLAEKTIAKGGVVFGAKFNEEWGVVHDYTEHLEGLSAFRGSKYVQSVIGEAYKQAENFLKKGRSVLFSGTPCQIAGLKRYLRREYENLVTIDIVCHGVPSPLVWREYLKSVVSQGENIQYVNMRDKRNGWSSYCINIKTEQRSMCTLASKNLYIEGFLKDIYLRPSCYACPSKGGSSSSDITLGDYWGVAKYHHDFADEIGVGLLLAWSESGDGILSRMDCGKIESTYDNAMTCNPSIKHSVVEPTLRNVFWMTFEKEGIVAIEKICRFLRPSLLSRILLKIKTIIKYKY